MRAGCRSQRLDTPRRTPGCPAVPGRPWKYATPSGWRVEPAGRSAVEVARQEDGLAPREAGPRRRLRRRTPSRPAIRARCMRVVVDRPARRVADDEQPRVGAPATRPRRDGRTGARTSRCGATPERSPAQHLEIAVGDVRGAARTGSRPTLVDLAPHPVEHAWQLLGVVEPETALADELWMAAAAQVRPPADRTRVPRAARSSTGRRGSRRGRRPAAAGWPPARATATADASRPNERRLATVRRRSARAARGSRLPSSQRQGLGPFARVVRPARGDDPERRREGDSSYDDAGRKIAGSGALCTTTGLWSSDPELAVLGRGCSATLDDRRVGKAVEPLDDPVDPVVVPPVGPDRAVDAVHESDVVPVRSDAAASQSKLKELKRQVEVPPEIRFVSTARPRRSSSPTRARRN